MKVSKPTVSVVTGSMSTTNPDSYSQFLPRYWAAIAAMDPLPDQVVIAHNVNDYCGVTDVPKDFPVPVKLVPVENGTRQDFHIAAFGAVETEWMSFCGLDDRMLPGAYKDLQSATDSGADICVSGIEMTNGRKIVGKWSLDYIKPYNCIPCHSPFTKRLWDELGPWPDLHWNDWAWWAKCWVNGVKAYESDNYVALFDVGTGHVTESGPLLDVQTRMKADEEIHKFFAGLGI
jgi:hypothetical protein